MHKRNSSYKNTAPERFKREWNTLGSELWKIWYRKIYRNHIICHIFKNVGIEPILDIVKITFTETATTKGQKYNFRYILFHFILILMYTAIFVIHIAIEWNKSNISGIFLGEKPWKNRMNRHKLHSIESGVFIPLAWWIGLWFEWQCAHNAHTYLNEWAHVIYC